MSFDVTASVANDDDLGRRIVESYEPYRALVNGAGPISQTEYFARRGAVDLLAGL